MNRETEESIASTNAAMDKTRYALKNEVRRGVDLIKEFRDEVRDKLVLVGKEAREAGHEVVELRKAEGNKKAWSLAVKRAKEIWTLN